MLCHSIEAIRKDIGKSIIEDLMRKRDQAQKKTLVLTSMKLKKKTKPMQRKQPWI